MADVIAQQQHQPHLLAQLCAIEAEDRKARSIRYQIGVAKFPVSKGIDTFEFDGVTIWMKNTVRNFIVAVMIRVYWGKIGFYSK